MRRFRHWLLIVLAIWIPLQSIAAFALPSERGAAAVAQAGAVAHGSYAMAQAAGDHECCDETGMALDGCDQCAACLACPGVGLLVAPATVPAGTSRLVFVVAESLAPASRLPATPERPPIAA